MKNNSEYTSLRDELLASRFQAAPDLASQGQPTGPAGDFDPIALRDLLREAMAMGHNPSRLVMGRQEADAFRRFLLEEFEEVATTPLRDRYYLGLHLAEEDTPSKMELAGEKGPDADQFRPPWRDLDSPPAARQSAA